MGHTHSINGLPLPQQLVDLVQSGQWRHPGDDILHRAIPSLSDPIDFLENVEQMRLQSSCLTTHDLKPLGIQRGGDGAIDLPMLDGERAFFIAVCRTAGDDVAIALDYREDLNAPRVVASYWQDNRRCLWQLVAPHFPAFLQMLRAEA